MHGVVLGHPKQQCLPVKHPSVEEVAANDWILHGPRMLRLLQTLFGMSGKTNLLKPAVSVSQCLSCKIMQGIHESVMSPYIPDKAKLPS